MTPNQQSQFGSTTTNDMREYAGEQADETLQSAKQQLNDVLDGITDRAADCWEPLVAIADAAGGDWPRLAREAAKHFTRRSADETLTTGTELLSHVRYAFADENHLPTSTLLERLRDRDESPWKDIRGRPLDDRGLAKRLKGYGIKSKTVRVGTGTAKGYTASDFADAWKRYLAPLTDSRHKGNSRHIFDNKNNFVSDVTAVTGVKAEAEPDDWPELPPEFDRRGDNDPFATLQDPKLKGLAGR